MINPRRRILTILMLCPILAWSSTPDKPPGPGCSLSFNESCSTNVISIADGPNSMIIDSILIDNMDTFLYDIDLITNIVHTYSDDLMIDLISPSGTVVTITTDNGDSLNNVYNGTLWDDDATNTVTDYQFLTNNPISPLIPEGALGAFIGENPNGKWKIKIIDDAAMDVGTWSGFCLRVSALDTIAEIFPETIFTENVNAMIPDGPVGMITSSLAVSGLTGSLIDIDLTTFISHTFSNDLTISLLSPEGTTILITSKNGGNTDHVYNGTVWDDSGTSPVTDATFVNNIVATPLVPEGALSALVGEDPNGLWILTISDDTGLDIGILHSWSLNIDTGRCGQVINPIPTVSAWGLIILSLCMVIIGTLSTSHIAHPSKKLIS